MNSLELVFALLALTLFVSFALSAEKNIIAKQKEGAALLSAKATAVFCAASLNMYYAAAGGLLRLEDGCAPYNGKVFSGLKSADIFPPAFRDGSGILVQVEGHYG